MQACVAEECVCVCVCARGNTLWVMGEPPVSHPTSTELSPQCMLPRPAPHFLTHKYMIYRFVHNHDDSNYLIKMRIMIEFLIIMVESCSGNFL